MPSLQQPAKKHPPPPLKIELMVNHNFRSSRILGWNSRYCRKIDIIHAYDQGSTVMINFTRTLGSMVYLLLKLK